MMPPVQILIGKVGLVLLLVIGAISPLFRNDREATVAAAVSISLLGIYSLVQVVRTHSWHPPTDKSREP